MSRQTHNIMISAGSNHRPMSLVFWLGLWFHILEGKTSTPVDGLSAKSGADNLQPNAWMIPGYETW